MSNSDKTSRIGIDARLWNETGVGRYIRNLVGELEKIDTVNEYVLFVLGKDKDQVRFQISNLKFKIHVADIPWHTIREQREFPKILEKEKLDLMHFPYFSVPIWYKGKYILTIHDLILHHFPTGKASTKSPLIYWLKHKAYKYIISQAVKNADKIITVSNATKKEIISDLHIPEEKISVIYEGVDEKIQEKGLKKEATNYELPTTNYFLYVGNAYPHKNLEILIEAFAKLWGPASRQPHIYPQGDPEYGAPRSRVTPWGIKLILVGKQDYFYRRLENKVKESGLKETILFKHNINDEELSALYQHALSLVMPSFMEGFGLPLLEAMAKGCLVVASDISSFKEIGENIPIYFSPHDVNQLANVLESIAKGRIKDVKERKEKGRLQAKKYSWEVMARQTIKIYQSCLGL